MIVIYSLLYLNLNINDENSQFIIFIKNVLIQCICHIFTDF